MAEAAELAQNRDAGAAPMAIDEEELPVGETSPLAKLADGVLLSRICHCVPQAPSGCSVDDCAQHDGSSCCMDTCSREYAVDQSSI